MSTNHYVHMVVLLTIGLSESLYVHLCGSVISRFNKVLSVTSNQFQLNEVIALQYIYFYYCYTACL